MIKRLTETELKMDEMLTDTLREISNIGAGNAATFLSEKTGLEIKLDVPICSLVSHEQAAKFIEAPEGLVISVFASLKGAIIGTTMIIFSKESAFAMADLLQKRKIRTTEWLSEKDQNELKQMGHSLLQCYLNAISDFLNLKARTGEFRMFSTIGDAIMDLLYFGIEKPAEGPVLVLKNEITSQEHFKGKIMFLFFLRMKDAESLLTKATLLLTQEAKQ